MGKKIVAEVSREPYVYDGSAEAGRKAFARAHAPYKCGLCPEWVTPGTPHRHFDDKGEFHASGEFNIDIEEVKGGKDAKVRRRRSPDAVFQGRREDSGGGSGEVREDDPPS